MSAKHAWACIASFVLGFNIYAPQGGTLSEQMDAWIIRHPFLARVGVMIVALHIANLVPVRWDAIHWLFVSVGTWKSRRWSK